MGEVGGLVQAILEAAPQLAGAILIPLAMGVICFFYNRAQTQSFSATEARLTAELSRQDVAHDQELKELRDDIKGYREDIDKLNAEIDNERKLRRVAEDEAAVLRRGGRPGGGAHRAGGQP